MLTLNEIANISFRKSRGAGYKSEDVDEFIDKVVESYDLLIKKSVEQKEQIETLLDENKRLQTSVNLMKSEQKTATKPASAADDVKLSEECEYTQEEIKNALLSAQKLANATIREARQKAETLLGEANTKAERIVSVAQGEVTAQKEELERLRKLVSDFRASLLDKYKEHLKLVNALPTQRGGVEAAPAEQPVSDVTPKQPEPTPQAEQKPAAKPEAKKHKKAVEPNLADIEKKEEMSQTRSFRLGNQLDETGEFSELKFGADYDIDKV